MAATVTLRQILIELVERYGLGFVTPLSSQTTTTLVLTTEGSPELRGPFTGRKIAIGSPVIITQETSGTDVLGDRTYVSDWAPSTGTVTVSPAIGGTDASEAIILRPEIGDPDRLIEAVNRAVQNRLGRWELRPLTFVPDGDMQGSTVTDYWTAAANGTASYVSAQVFPASSADAFGQVGLNRAVQLVSAGGATSMDSNGIRVTPNVSTTGLQWYFLTAIRLVSGTGTVTLSVRDNTNAAAITTNIIRGNSDNTFTQTVIGDFLICEGTFDIPEDCGEIAFRLELSAAGMTAQLAPIIAFPTGAHAFPLPNRIETTAQLGNFYSASVRTSPAGFPHVALYQEVIQHSLHDYGDHLTVTFDCIPARGIWYEEYVNGSALTAMTDTTTFPLERVVKWAYAELTDRLMHDELAAGKRAENGVPLPSIWRPVRNAALKSATWSGYEPQVKTVFGRR